MRLIRSIMKTPDIKPTEVEEKVERRPCNCTVEERELLDKLRECRLENVTYVDRSSVSFTLTGAWFDSPNGHDVLRTIYKVVRTW